MLSIWRPPEHVGSPVSAKWSHFTSNQVYFQGYTPPVRAVSERSVSYPALALTPTFTGPRLNSQQYAKAVC